MIIGRLGIQRHLESGAIHCDPAPAAIEATHIDVHVGEYYWTQRHWMDMRSAEWAFWLTGYIYGEYAPDESEERSLLSLRHSDFANAFALHRASERGAMILPPLSMTLMHTQEFIGSTVPDIEPNIDTRSTVARAGIAIHLSAGVGDPGFHSRWTLEVFNTWTEPVVLYVGDRIGCVKFQRVEEADDALYTERYNQSKEQWTPESMLPRKGNV